MDCQVFQKGTKNSQALYLPEHSQGPATLITHWSSEPRRIWATRGWWDFWPGGRGLESEAGFVLWPGLPRTHLSQFTNPQISTARRKNNKWTNKRSLCLQTRERSMNSVLLSGHDVSGSPQSPPAHTEQQGHRTLKQASWVPSCAFHRWRETAALAWVTRAHPPGTLTLIIGASHILHDFRHCLPQNLIHRLICHFHCGKLPAFTGPLLVEDISLEAEKAQHWRGGR